MTWRVPGKKVEAEFDGETLEIRPVSAGAYVDFLESQESVTGSIAKLRCYARLVVRAAYKDDELFFKPEDADELVKFATASPDKARQLAALVDVTAEACGIDPEGARKN